jgi:hypothetical protein
LFAAFFLEILVAEMASLFFVTVKAIDGGDGAKQAVDLVVDAGGEIQRIRQGRGSVVRKDQGPKPVNGHDGIIVISHEAPRVSQAKLRPAGLRWITSNLDSRQGYREINFL